MHFVIDVIYLVHKLNNLSILKNKYKNMNTNDRRETLIKYAEESEKTVDLFLTLATAFLVLIGIWFACMIVYVTPVDAHGADNALCENLYRTDTEEAKRLGCDLNAIEKDIMRVKQGKLPSVDERAFNLIVKYEWYADKPYWDHKQWSCGYGMRCTATTTGITKEKSKMFLVDRIQTIRERFKLHDIDDDIEVGLISFIYNIGHPPVGYRWFIAHWHINALKNRMKEYSYAWGKYLRGLQLRRVDESSFTN